MRTPLTSEALASFMAQLRTGAHGVDPHNAPELLDRWSIDMETQINVHAANGVPVDGKKGCFEDPDTGFSWWNLRIPKGAATGVTHFEDKPLPWPPIIYAAGIGCTGWDWKEKVSRWVGFDFDSITGHAKGVGVEDEELHRVREAVQGLPWVEVRRSTGGQGLHLYVLLDNIPIENHTDHTALARCVLTEMTRATEFDFASSIDTCGGNMWIWHRKMTAANEGLKLLKPAECKLGAIDLSDWKNHRNVMKRKRSKVAVGEGEAAETFDKLAEAQAAVDLDDQHKAIIAAIRDSGSNVACEWIPDHNCLQTHTTALVEIPHRGVFKTISEGKDTSTPNCFMFPRPHGAWIVFRFSPGTAEDSTWEQDNEGWTRCNYNTDPDLRTAAKASGGRFDGDKSIYEFDRAEDALEAIKMLGGNAPLPEQMHGQKTKLKIGKSGRLMIEVDAPDDPDDETGDLTAWTPKKGRGKNAKVVTYTFTTDLKPLAEQKRDLSEFDNRFRCLATPSKQPAGWLLQTDDGEWKEKSKDEVRLALIAMGVPKNDLDVVMGNATLRDWTLVNLPFQPMWPGGRQCNLDAPQLRYTPADPTGDEQEHPHFDLVFDHLFGDLNEALKTDPWAVANSITAGREYGMLWASCLIREPFQPLPYLFFYGPQDNGKSLLIEVLQNVLLRGGCAACDRAFRNNSDFNGELANVVVAYIDEHNINMNSEVAYNRLKQWTTSPMLSIRKMRTDQFEVRNCLHFIQVANSADYVPIQPGDTRIVAIQVPALREVIPKMTLMEKLHAEAPAFLRTLLDMRIPGVVSRLRIPALATDTKKKLEDENKNAIERFFDEACVFDRDAELPYGEVYDRFYEWVDAESKHKWGKKTFGKKLPVNVQSYRPRGRDYYLKGIRWKEDSAS